MKDPVMGHNATESFVEYETTLGRMRFGQKNTGAIFAEMFINNQSQGKVTIIDNSGVLNGSLLSLINQTFLGTVDLTRSLTHYSDYTVSTNVVLAAGSNPIPGASVILRMIGDGSHSPDFSAFKQETGSDTFDSSANAINLVRFFYDGTSVIYKIINIV